MGNTGAVRCTKGSIWLFWCNEKYFLSIYMYYKISVKLTIMKGRSEKLYKLSTQINRSVTKYAGRTITLALCPKVKFTPCTSMTCFFGPTNHIAAFRLCQSRFVVSLQSSLTSQSVPYPLFLPLNLLLACLFSWVGSINVCIKLKNCFVQ